MRTSRLIRRLSQLDRRVAATERSAQAAARSIEGGAVVVYDSDGNLVQETGVLADGQVGTATYSSESPSAPAEFIVGQNISALSVSWDGKFVGAQPNGVLIDYIGVHMVIPPDPDDPDQQPHPLGLDTEFARLPATGGVISLPADADVEVEIYLVAVSSADSWSTPAGPVVATAQYGLEYDAVPRSDGLAPAESPEPRTLGGIGLVFVQWTAVVNDSPVTYEIHVSAFDTPVTPGDPATLIEETDGSMVSVRHLPGGEPMQYEMDYWFTVIAKDVDGSASPSTPVVGRMDRTQATDLSAQSVTAEKLAGLLVLASTIATAEAGARTTIDGDGIRTYDSAGELIFNMPTKADADGRVRALIGAEVHASALFAENFALAGQNNSVQAGASLELESGIQAPFQEPTVTTGWGTALINSSGDTDMGDLTLVRCLRYWRADPVDGTPRAVAYVASNTPNGPRYGFVELQLPTDPATARIEYVRTIYAVPGDEGRSSRPFFALDPSAGTVGTIYAVDVSGVSNRLLTIDIASGSARSVTLDSGFKRSRISGILTDLGSQYLVYHSAVTDDLRLYKLVMSTGSYTEGWGVLDDRTLYSRVHDAVVDRGGAWSGRPGRSVFVIGDRPYEGQGVVWAYNWSTTTQAMSREFPWHFITPKIPEPDSWESQCWIAADAVIGILTGKLLDTVVARHGTTGAGVFPNGREPVDVAFGFTWENENTAMSPATVTTQLSPTTRVKVLARQEVSVSMPPWPSMSEPAKTREVTRAAFYGALTGDPMRLINYVHRPASIASTMDMTLPTVGALEPTSNTFPPEGFGIFKAGAMILRGDGSGSWPDLDQVKDSGRTYIGTAGAPAFKNGWANYATNGTEDAYFRKVGNDLILRGVIAGGAEDLPAFTLPVGYRPDKRAILLAVAQVTTGPSEIGVRVEIAANGDVIPSVPAGAYLSLDGIRLTLS